ncbi:MAG: GntG family PLP-dependent aldolase [Pseudomonadota bacterium]
MSLPVIDFLSDTVTQPTASMRRAIAQATVGDDGYGEDPTVKALEHKTAQRLGKASACLMPSGVMANLSAMMAHCSRGAEVLVADTSDIYNYEAGGASVLGGLVYHPVPTSSDGRFDLKALRAAFRDSSDPQCAPCGLICVENPNNVCGGRVLPLSHLEEIREISIVFGVPVHMDGARIFNAERATGIAAAAFAEFADSVQLCLSKSLCAPVGSMLVGSDAFVTQARRLRKMLGGSMRQSGILAAAGLIALDEMVERLDDDHRRAKKLACGLMEIHGLDCDPSETETNMVFFRLREGVIDNAGFLERLAIRGIRMGELGHGRIRAALHAGIDDMMIDKTLDIIFEILASGSGDIAGHSPKHDV